MKEELLKGLSEEQIAKVKECKSQEELLAFAKEEGIELTDEQLEAVNGGACTVEQYELKCPSCESKDFELMGVTTYGDRTFKCKKCGKSFNK